jgi:hypothetical protein
MRTSLAVSLVAAIAASSATHLVAAVIPPIGLSPGSQYQLVFVTADMTTATSANVADYNSFVAAEAALNPSLPATTWSAAVSTPNINAYVNAPSGPYPVYNTQGIEVAAAGQGLYIGSLLAPIQYDQFGVATTFSMAWSGNYFPPSPTPPSMFGLGDLFPGPEWGNPNSTGSAWYSDSATTADTLLPTYALSAPITFVPEPAAITLLASACLLIGGMRLLCQHRGRG